MKNDSRLMISTSHLRMVGYKVFEKTCAGRCCTSDDIKLEHQKPTPHVYDLIDLPRLAFRSSILELTEEEKEIMKRAQRSKRVRLIDDEPFKYRVEIVA